MSLKVGRIGCVPYLNAKPLIFGIEDQVRLEIPSILAQSLRQNQLDAALIPIVEYLENPHYQIVPGIGIGCRGPVRSVYLAYRGPISQLRSVALDTASKTSNLLLQVILGEFFGLTPKYEMSDKNGLCDGQLIIGDPALLNRNHFIQEGFHLLDLGEIWLEQTGLPFVFAFWAVRNDLAALPYIELFTQAKENGLQHLEEMVAAEKILPTKAVREYLTRCIQYGFGTEEVKGFLEFQRLCVQQGLIEKSSELKLAK